MSSFIINIKKSSGSWATKADVATIVPDIGFNYTDKLNEVNAAIINLSGTGEVKRDIIDIGAEIKIYKDGTLDFHGLINTIDYLEAGGISIQVRGYEWWLGLENGAYGGSPWTSTASATIFNAILGESNYFTAGTVEAGTSVDYRLSVTDSLWNAISNLKLATSQDIGIDYPNSEIDILDHKGSASSVKTFNAGIQIGDVRITQNYPLANKVLVYGKSEGETRITSSYPTYGKDASSQSTYGIITKIIRDPKIITQAQANLLADAEVAKLKDPIKVYAFEVLNPSQSLVSGDVITLNARSQGVTNEDVRIVGIERGIRGSQEYMTLQVTNAAYSELTKSVDQLMAGIDKTFRDQQTYDEYDDEYSNQNVDTTVGGFMTTTLGEFRLNDVVWIDHDDGYLTLAAYNNINLYPGYGAGSGTVQVWDRMGMNSNQIYDLTDPSSNQHAATKKYVDDNIGTPGDTVACGEDNFALISNIDTNWQTIATVEIYCPLNKSTFLSFSCDASLYLTSAGEYFKFQFTRDGNSLSPPERYIESVTGDKGIQVHHQKRDILGTAGTRTYRVQCKTKDGTGDLNNGSFIVMTGLTTDL